MLPRLPPQNVGRPRRLAQLAGQRGRRRLAVGAGDRDQRRARIEEPIGELDLGDHLDAGGARGARLGQRRHAGRHHDQVGARVNVVEVDGRRARPATGTPSSCCICSASLSAGLPSVTIDARAAPRAELRDRDAGLREPDDDDRLAVEIHRRAHRSFSVPSATSASSARDQPEPDDDLRLVPALLLVVVVDRRHREHALADDLAVAPTAWSP